MLLRRASTSKKRNMAITYTMKRVMWSTCTHVALSSPGLPLPREEFFPFPLPHYIRGEEGVGTRLAHTHTQTCLFVMCSNLERLRGALREFCMSLES